ncbi:hypothetical protein ACCUM_3495 [Candidatus Accumulibacter phosphatis]|uniref:Uncharacterized protein n=1 Tax=Candidatus Accumulibacter phosphatis TaxID=327160 RepID=A0A5S4EPA5_9PROT|nr:hypothetical protein ACCUM_3495 [Candidatus Accumulibacter phosphatis]
MSRGSQASDEIFRFSGAHATRRPSTKKPPVGGLFMASCD